MTAVDIVGATMLCIFSFGVIVVVLKCMGSWKHTFEVIAVALFATLWVAVGGYLLFEYDKDEVNISEVIRVSE
jgi:hypothetical protein